MIILYSGLMSIHASILLAFGLVILLQSIGGLSFAGNRLVGLISLVFCVISFLICIYAHFPTLEIGFVFSNSIELKPQKDADF